LLLVAFILLIHTHKQFNVQTDFIIETSQNTNRGIQYAINHSLPLNDTLSVDLKDEDYKTLKVSRNYWGIHQKVTSVSSIKKHTLKKVALVGGRQKEINRTSLYIQDNNKSLVVVGSTKIDGVAYLPKQGVKPGSISGQSYYGSQLIYGSFKKSSLLPKIFQETLEQIEEIENQMVNIKPNQFLKMESDKVHINSFLEPKQIIFSNTEIKLNNIELVGHIVIQSKTKISVDESSNLKDVVLIAPEIEIKNNVKGNFQALASKKITVGKYVDLEYPSALILSKNKIIKTSLSLENKTKSNIIIDSFSTIEGVVLYTSQHKINNYNPQIKIEDQAKVIGEVYSTENVELKGIVYGSVFANNFIAKEFGSVYLNHIYNGTIQINKLPEEYVGLPFNNSKKGVIKWLY